MKNPPLELPVVPPDILNIRRFAVVPPDILDIRRFAGGAPVQTFWISRRIAVPLLPDIMDIRTFPGSRGGYVSNIEAILVVVVPCWTAAARDPCGSCLRFPPSHDRIK